MADPGLTEPNPDPAAPQIIDAYLAELSRWLVGVAAARAAILAELAGGL